MTKYFLLLTVLLMNSSVFAQDYPLPLITKGNPGDALYGISKDMVYECIIETNLTKKQVIEKTKEVLDAIGFENLDKLKVETITDKQQKIVLETALKSGTYAGKGKSAISKRLKSPAELMFTMTFDFYESGKLKIQFSNFGENVFFKIGKDGKFFIEYHIKNMSKPEVTQYDDRHKKIVEIEEKVMKAGTFMGKLDTFMENGPGDIQLGFGPQGFQFNQKGGVKEAREKLKTEVLAEWAILDQAVKDKVGIWGDPGKDKDFLSLYHETIADHVKFKEETKQRMTENVLLVIDNDRFEKYYELKFNDFFVLCAANMDGKVIGIAKDGELKYEVDDKFKVKKASKKKK